MPSGEETSRERRNEDRELAETQEATSSIPQTSLDAAKHEDYLPVIPLTPPLEPVSFSSTSVSDSAATATTTSKETSKVVCFFSRVSEKLKGSQKTTRLKIECDRMVNISADGMVRGTSTADSNCV